MSAEFHDGSYVMKTPKLDFYLLPIHLVYEEPVGHNFDQALAGCSTPGDHTMTNTASKKLPRLHFISLTAYEPLFGSPLTLQIYRIFIRLTNLDASMPAIMT